MAAADVPIEWTARRPRKRTFVIRLTTALSVACLYGLVWVSSGDPPIRGMVTGGLVLVLVLAVIESEYTYRATTTGLERRPIRWGPTKRTHFAWETSSGFSVTNDAIVLHRPFPQLDRRWSRADIIETEPAIVEALEEHLDRRA
ncbi:hypothetical protein C479_09753 [Halovivax asiaticus JCM 14624]|uniref:PH domain-containing protein n=1 Tax=Halovivax asiaticus JCM 14624 TaxID=1227490 RepID=M0BNA6_9EURY|nr:hypothetical protein [Halovivax asiaticus]ELZ11084.1 hypothetical protein C479_09753 [Halovivax asiaticus JCM 14624]